jgi:hypothetical protein
MKKSFIFLCVILLSAGTSIASTWNLDNGVTNGSWIELFGNGNPGSPDSLLMARSDMNYSDQWLLVGQLENAIMTSSNPLIYTTQYNNGSLQLSADPGKWGTAVNVPITAVNTSNHDPSGNLLSFNFVGVGQLNSLQYTFKALFSVGPDNNYLTFDSTTIGNALAGLPDEYANVNYPGNGHLGSGFQTLELSITPVPLPPAALMLGPGLICLIAMRRKFNR